MVLVCVSFGVTLEHNCIASICVCGFVGRRCEYGLYLQCHPVIMRVICGLYFVSDVLCVIVEREPRITPRIFGSLFSSCR